MNDALLTIIAQFASTHLHDYLKFMWRECGVHVVEQQTAILFSSVSAKYNVLIARCYFDDIFSSKDG